MKKEHKFKKSILAALLASGICLALPFSVSAATIESESIVVEATGSVLLDESVEYFSDGSSITTRLYEHTDFNQIATTIPCVQLPIPKKDLKQSRTKTLLEKPCGIILLEENLR